MAVRRRSTCRCWPRRPIKDSRLACSPATRPICRSRRQLLHSWLPYRRRTDAKICKSQPSIPGRPEARRPASLVTTGLSHGSKQDTLACPPHPARNSSTSLKSLSRPGEHHLARRSQGPPSPLPPAPANEQPPRVSNSVSDHNSYISPSLLQGNILPNPPPSPTIDSHSQGSFLNGGSGAGP